MSTWFKVTVIATCALIFFQTQLWSQTIGGIWENSPPLITNYTSDDYKAELQNWCIAQGDNGFIYVGNNSGILEFDARSWRLIRTERQSPVRSLAKDKQGRIYVGGIGEIGYLEQNASGQLAFRSLLNKLDISVRDFGDVWSTYVVGDMVYFVCEHYVFCWDGTAFHVITDEGYRIFGFSWLVSDTVYINTISHGLLRIANNKLVKVHGGKAFAEKNIWSLLPESRKSMLAISKTGEMYRFDGNDLIPDGFEHTKFNGKIYYGQQLSGGDYALGSASSGFYLLDKSGNKKINLTRRDGLTSNAIYFVFEDAEGDVWLATDNGVSRIEINSPIRVLDGRNGIEETPFDIEYFNGALYVSSAKGLSRLKTVTHDGSSRLEFEQVPGITNVSQTCHVVGDQLLVSSQDGVFVVDENNSVQRIYAGYSTVLEDPSLRDQDVLLLETARNGIIELTRKNGKWTVGTDKLGIDDLAHDIIRLDDNRVFVNTRRNGLVEVKWQRPPYSLGNTFTTTSYDTTKGLSSLHVHSIENIHDKLYVTTAKGVHTFDPKEETFKPADEITALLSPRPGSFVDQVVASKEKSFWIVIYHDYQSQIIRSENDELIEFPAARRFSNALVTKVYDSKEDVVVFGSNKSLFLYKTSDNDFRNLFRTQIRKVITKDSVVNPALTSDSHPFTIPYDRNDLTIELSLPSFDYSEANEFQYKLDGLRDEWSEWSTQNTLQLSNLHEGRYTLQVKGRNIYGVISDGDPFSFIIQPPWFRRWWSYVLYALSLMAIVAGAVKWRLHDLKEEKIALEKIVQERTDEILLQAEKLKEMDQLKSSFFANVSHEFRTPLTLILAPLENELKRRSKSEGNDTLLLVRRSANRLLELVNQLLDISKLESRKMDLIIKPGDLRQFLGVIVAPFDSLAGQKGVSFETDITLEHKLFWFDHDKLEKVITNLLSNALKFTPPGGTVNISARSKNDRHLQMEISDTGPGIPFEEQSKVFDPFYQVRQTSGYQQGTGLGLSLVRELINLYKGKIDLKSQPGHGTTFLIEIPIDKQSFEPTQIIEETQSEFMTQRTFDPETSDGTNDGSAAMNAGKDCVLLVEDNHDMRYFISSTLQNHGLEVVTAKDGAEGLNLAQQLIPNLVLSDLMMPVMDGIELTRRIKTDERTSHIPVILLTAKNEQQSKLQGLRTGADDYLTKPFMPDELIVRIENLIAQRKMLADKFRERIIISASPINEISLDDKFMLKARSVVEAYLGDYRFSVENMADEMGLSRTQLLRKLKALTGMSPTDFIKNIRLGRAADMIKQKVDTISQIGYAVGFNDQSYFTKCFKKQFGVTPTEFSQAPGAPIL